MVPGNTVAVLFAEKKQFLDTTHGIRLEQNHLNFVFIFKCKLEELVAEAEHIRKVECSVCLATKEKKKLMHCTVCKVARYCSRDCQKQHWTSIHKKTCNQMRTLSKLLERLPNKFNEFFSFSDLSS